jgi:hypothetical protein
MVSYSFNGREVSFDYNMKENIKGSVYGMPEAYNLYEKGEDVGFPFQYDYVRLFHGTQKSVFYSNEHKPNPKHLTESSMDFFANSASILRQGYYRSRNDRIDPEDPTIPQELSEDEIWETKMGDRVNTATKGIFMSWVPSNYGNIIFDVLLPTSKLRINYGAGETNAAIENLEDMKSCFDSHEEFLKHSVTGAEASEVVLRDEIPLKNIIGVAENNRRKSHQFVKFQEFVNSLDHSKLPDRSSSHMRKSIRRFEKLKKVHELINSGSSNIVNPIDSLLRANLFGILFKLYNSKRFPKMTISDYELMGLTREGLREILVRARGMDEEERFEKIQENADRFIEAIDAYNRSVEDLNEIMDSDSEVIEISSIGNIRSLVRNGVKTRDIRKVLKDEMRDILKLHRKHIVEEGTELPEEAKREEQKIKSVIDWFPILKIEPYLRPMIENKSSKKFQNA